MKYILVVGILLLAVTVHAENISDAELRKIAKESQTRSERLQELETLQQQLASINPADFLDIPLLSELNLNNRKSGEHFLIGTFGGNYSIERFIDDLLEFKLDIDPGKQKIPDNDPIRKQNEQFIQASDEAIVNTVLSEIRKIDSAEERVFEMLNFVVRDARSLGFRGEGFKARSVAGENNDPQNFHNGFTGDADIFQKLDDIFNKNEVDVEAVAELIEDPQERSIVQQQLDGVKNPSIEDLQNIFAQRPQALNEIDNQLNGIQYKGGQFVSVGKKGNFEFQGAGFFRNKDALKGSFFILNRQGQIEAFDLPFFSNRDEFRRVRQAREIALGDKVLDTGDVESITVRANDNTDGNNFSGFTKFFDTGDTVVIKGEQYTIHKAMNWSPIIIDLDNNMIPDVNRYQWQPHAPAFFDERTALFDITGNGLKEFIEWLGPNDGLLVKPEKDLTIKGAHNLFGTAGGYNDGYEKMAETLDKDKNDWVEGDELEGLYIWQDKNKNAKLDDKEMLTVQQIGLEKIYVRHHKFVSVCFIKGKRVVTWDWWPSGFQVVPHKYQNTVEKLQKTDK